MKEISELVNRMRQFCSRYDLQTLEITIDAFSAAVSVRMIRAGSVTSFRLSFEEIDLANFDTIEFVMARRYNELLKG